ncbi:MAG: hypothetical protein A2289_26425 [Deltaproteobacteria bacterium RIFOXYA12_FULL_58_15]|nr:MAG: hypothetical protein A2289_26425 [Deltaproteobacteria bacterium RIFOXYA12_FULL_58_15]
MIATSFSALPVFAQGAECPSGMCGTPIRSAIATRKVVGLVAMTDRGDTYAIATRKVVGATQPVLAKDVLINISHAIDLNQGF